MSEKYQVYLNIFQSECEYLNDAVVKVRVDERKTKFTLSFLLSRGAAIKVLSPEWLAQAVRQGHLDAARLYE